MTKTTLPRVHWDTIVRTIYKGSCVPFLGAGVNVEGLDNKEGLPLGGEVALRLLEAMLESKRNFSDLKHAINHRSLREYRASTEAALTSLGDMLPNTELQSVRDRFNEILRSILQGSEKEEKLAHIIFDETLEQYKELTRVGLQDLARVSLRYRMNNDLEGFINKLKEIIPDAERKPSRLLKTLADLPFKLIVTTNYDRLMERALELIRPSSIIEPDGLAVKIKTGATLVEECIHESLSEEVSQWLDKYDEKNPAFCFAPLFWSEELNRIIQDTRLYLLENNALTRDGVTEQLLETIDALPLNNEAVQRNRLVLEKTFKSEIRPHHKVYQTLVQPINGFQGTAENNTRKVLSELDGVLLYKLHGTFSDAKPTQATRPVVTEEDYIEFLTFVGAKGEGIDNQIKEKIKDSTMLFLGYSLEDWNFRALFKGLVEKVTTEERSISFAIQKNPSEFWIRFWAAKNVNIFNVDLHDFAEELEERYQAYKKEVEEEEIEKARAKAQARAERGRRRHAPRT